MLKILKNPHNSEIKRAIEDNWYKFIKSWSELGIEGFEHEDNDQLFKFMSGVPYFRLNGVLDTHISHKLAEKTV